MASDNSLISAALRDCTLVVLDDCVMAADPQSSEQFENFSRVFYDSHKPENMGLLIRCHFYDN